MCFELALRPLVDMASLEFLQLLRVNTDPSGAHLPTQDLHLWFLELGFGDLQEIGFLFHLVEEFVGDFSV